MSSPAITITGTISDFTGTPDVGTISFTLCNYAPQIPRVGGVSILDQVVVKPVVGGGGAFSITLYGNDVISPGPNITYYSINITSSTGNSFSGAYQFTGSGTFDLSNLTPLNTGGLLITPSGAVLLNPTGNQTILGFPLFVPQLNVNGATSGSTALVSSAVASGTMTVQSGTDFLVARSTTDVFTNKTLDTAGTGNVFKINGTSISSVIGSGAVVLATSPTITTPTISGNVAGNVGLAGLISTYNSIPTVSNGVPSEVASVSLTGQTNTISTTTLYAVPANGAGQYRLSWNAKVTTPAGTSSTLGAFGYKYTDPDGIVIDESANAIGQVGPAIGQTNTQNTGFALILGMPVLINCKASTNIQYNMAYASNPANAMAYNLNIILEKM